MPFKSKAQARYMFAKHPKTAKEFAEHTKNMNTLPQHAAKAKGSGVMRHARRSR